MVSFTEAIKTCITKKFATISGRATRSEYWWFQLFIYVVTFTLMIFGAALEKKGGEIFTGIGFIFYIIMMIPNFCSRVRRLHDGGHSGWFLFWNCIPYIGGFIVLFAELQESDRDNKYGPCSSRLNLVNSNTNLKTVIIKENPTSEEKIEEITDVDL